MSKTDERLRRQIKEVETMAATAETVSELVTVVTGLIAVLAEEMAEIRHFRDTLTDKLLLLDARVSSVEAGWAEHRDAIQSLTASIAQRLNRLDEVLRRQKRVMEGFRQRR